MSDNKQHGQNERGNRNNHIPAFFKDQDWKQFRGPKHSDYDPSYVEVKGGWLVHGGRHGGLAFIPDFKNATVQVVTADDPDNPGDSKPLDVNVKNISVS